MTSKNTQKIKSKPSMNKSSNSFNSTADKTFSSSNKLPSMSIKSNSLDTSWPMFQSSPDKTLKSNSSEADMSRKSRALILNADDIRMKILLCEERFSNYRRPCLISDPKTVERMLICWMKESSNFKVKTLSSKTPLLCWDNKHRDWLWFKDRNPHKYSQSETNYESEN